ncbi:Glucose-1-phosphate thymidylyltransferase [hydrothermal vent metagenome]|uniref:Glucose-1-phosphate thymidylyltransferase n=1 Tax=hydrothermal vent metagenome TaxID=652676 RepID=A0A3B1API3_9ZZZZ
MLSKKPRVMLLAAGRGERMRPLTDHTPKPLLGINDDTSLIELHIKNLKLQGFTNIIINVAWLGQKIIEQLGDGDNYGVDIQYSNEHDTPLETAGGIIKALPLLGSEPFIAINSDIYSDFDYKLLALNPNELAQLILVPNPRFHPEGDFFMNSGKLDATIGEKYTFSGIAMYHPDFFKGLAIEVLALAPLLRKAILECKISAQVYSGNWFDIGTPERLNEIKSFLFKN